MELMSNETKFIGVQVGCNGVIKGDEHKCAVKEWPKPTNVVGQ